MTVLERSGPALACPSCDAPLTDRESDLRCSSCATTVPVEDGVPRFPVEDAPGETGPFDRLSAIYETPLWFRPLYRFVGGPAAPADDRRRLARLLDVEGALLDVACGTGRFTRYVAPRASFAWGVDRSDGMLDRARRYAERDGVENAAFARMDAGDLHFADGAFDRVACTWALHLFPDPDRALSEAHRVLAADGRLAGATLTDEYVMALPGVAAGARATIGARTFEADDLRERLRAAGFGGIDLDRRGGVLFFAADA